MSLTLTSTAVIGLLRERFPALANDRVHIFDTAYALLEDVLAGEYFDDLAADAQAALSRWRLNVSDCDKYARTLVWLAFMGHVHYATTQTGIAVGVICYVKDDPHERHAATLMLTSRKVQTSRIHSVRVFDAKEGRELHLSDAERASVYRIML